MKCRLFRTMTFVCHLTFEATKEKEKETSKKSKDKIQREVAQLKNQRNRFLFKTWHGFFINREMYVGVCGNKL